ncbi:MAG TPA: hypothetical protein VKY56_01200 [Chloroflexota bacterium]|nr:hypothetical protein [Chloroflexota bacterium]
MSIKVWTCPGCHREFIVDAEAVRDTCPWCHVGVEQKDNELRVVSEGEKPREASSGETSSGSPGAPNAGAAPGSGQGWWPFEYNS